MANMTVIPVFMRCVEAIRQGYLIEREGKKDKEFHFQNWFVKRLEETGFNYDQGGRNSYPDFTMVKFTEGYELKGLAYPGRDASFDSNSQVPTGFHNNRNIYYVFGRYPKEPDGNTFTVIELVICHGDFLNADHDYKHKNKNVKGFGSYGDIMIRDRKMYVVPTPFHIVQGVAHQHTLILPDTAEPGEDNLVEVGILKRVETAEIIVGYSFNLKTNEIVPELVKNPSAGKEHIFRAWRARAANVKPVLMRALEPSKMTLEVEGDESE